jgi:hypothetical protein
MIALLVQAIKGMLSDRSTHRWGKRRPFMLASTVLETAAFIAIGVIAAQMEGQAGYAALFAAVLLSMIFSNIGHGAAQGLIPDLVPESQRGRYSGLKTLFELPLPLIFVSFFVSRMVKTGNYWAAIITVIVTLIVCTILAMFIRETPQEKAPAPMDWPAIGRLAAMTVLFTAVILLAGEAVKRLVPLAGALPGLSRLLVTGVIGAIGMLVAVAVGVIFSMRISLGTEAAQKPALPGGRQPPGFSGGGEQPGQLFALLHSGTLPRTAGQRRGGPLGIPGDDCGRGDSGSRAARRLADG